MGQEHTGQRVDVIVCGGGSAGFAAAVTAARAGARTVLVEASGALGGVWSMSMLVGASDWRRKTALMREFDARLEALTGEPLRRDRSGIHPAVQESYAISPEWLKVAMEGLVVESGVRLRLYTRLCGVQREGDRIVAVDLASKSGLERWEAKVFVDATGDGDLGAGAGCAYELGRPDGGQTQPMSMHGLVTGLREEDVLPYCLGLPPEEKTERRHLLDDLERAGYRCSYSRPTLTRMGHGLFFLGVHHGYASSALDADSLTNATVTGRAEIAGAVAALRSLGGMWSRIELASTSPLIGVREGRRLRGLYTVTREDLIAGRRHDDAVCRVTFPVDVHSTDPAAHKGFSNEGVEMQPYDIPLRALIAADVDNLAMAGRCISGDFIAHASYRVVGNCIATGTAAGAACAWAALHDVPLQAVPFAALRFD